MEFLELVVQNNKKYEREPIHSERILCFDPGHTTGWAFFHQSVLQEAGQIDTNDMYKATEAITTLFTKFTPTIIVCEDYRVYSKFKDLHVGSEMLTTRVIGCIETLAAQNFINIIKQMAHVGKGFCKDNKLRMWGYFDKGEKHARDAIRHGCHYILFNRKNPKTKNPHRISVG